MNIIYIFQTFQETDEELRNNFSDILTRFYLAFESIHKYVTDLNFYVDELGDGVYIHQSVDSIMFNEEGKQLMVDVFYETFNFSINECSIIFIY
jgi:WASH complex subunit strumpellin